MEKIEERLQEKIDKIFPTERYNVTITGKALVFQKGTNYLLDNLVFHLVFAIFLIALLMAYYVPFVQNDFGFYYSKSISVINNSRINGLI